MTAAEYVQEGFIFLATPNIKSEEIDFQNVNYITEYRYLESPELQLRVGDVLLVKDGATLGINNFIRHLPAPATVNGSIAVLRPGDIDSAFLRYVLASDLIQGLIGSFKSGMGVPHLFQADLRKFPVPLPPHEVQTRIVAYLDRETSRIDALLSAVAGGRGATDRSLCGLLTERRQALITAAVTGKLEMQRVAT